MVGVRGKGGQGDVLDKGARLDAATAGARREPNAAGADDAAVVGEEVAIATQAGVAAVKEGRLVEVVLVLEPVPVLRHKEGQRFPLPIEG